MGESKTMAERIADAIDTGGGQACDVPWVIRALEAAGFVIVPREPTQNMFEAGTSANDKYATEIAPCSGFRTIDAWQAMIDAVLSEPSP